MYVLASIVVEVADGLEITLLIILISRWVQHRLTGTELIPTLSCRSYFHCGRGEPIASVTAPLEEFNGSLKNPKDSR